MEGSKLFWSSGTWVFFLAQAMVVVLVGYLYWYLGKKEKEACEGKNELVKDK
ncbi:MAG TPA: hypothetical protein PLV23_02095 [Sedimentibacter sp.]|jgi:cbb3-type cytochrome oxidase subunit 3|nr:hypothetical protein [Sedimentibacter sp.]HHZ00653.1 hypothetical protein [Tissierellia bacterium]HOK49696.1 hypothetical protein [Sedimentibacter sp.]HOW22402.1 hypothetical protein [Sedimentibacter sp.]HRC81649.1 hypothetical protein [Sedimentibacter sp.]